MSQQVSRAFPLPLPKGRATSPYSAKGKKMTLSSFPPHFLTVIHGCNTSKVALIIHTWQHAEPAWKAGTDYVGGLVSAGYISDQINLLFHLWRG